MGDIPRSKKEWHDGKERTIDGSIIVFSQDRGLATWMKSVPVCESPREAREIQKADEEGMIEFSHHADPEIPVYIRSEEIIAILPRFDKLEDEG